MQIDAYFFKPYRLTLRRDAITARNKRPCRATLFANRQKAYRK